MMASVESENCFENHSRFPDLRIVLLGSKEAGKTSAGNTILGEEVFNPGTTPQCVKKEGEVAGRHVTVVDTPGWSSYLRVKHTTDEDKQESSLSGSLCSPGPHAFLLVIPVKILYTKTQRAVVEEHMKLLGEGVWNHTLVLFTKGDSLRERTIEQYIKRKGRALQWLIKKCGNRYHVFNNMNRADDSQVTELMEKIGKMLAVNSGLHYEIEKKRLHETVEQNVGREEELPPDEGIDLTRKKEELDVMQTGKRTVTVGNNSPKSRRPDCIPDMGGENTSMRYTTMSESQMSLDSTTSSGYGSGWSITESTESVRKARLGERRLVYESPSRSYSYMGVMRTLNPERQDQRRCASHKIPPAMSTENNI